MAYTDKKISKWAMQHKSEFMQMVQVAAAESMFFDSIDVMSWHIHRLEASKMKPDFMMFGFTMGGVASVLSEKHKLPLMGFILQPTVIPSSDLQAVVPIDSHSMSFVDSMEKGAVGHGALKKMKGFFDKNPMWGALNSHRSRHGLEKQKKGTWHYYQKLDVPMIIPIRQYAFGDRPVDWTPKTVFTDFIF